MSAFIPCLNVDSGNTTSGSGIQLVTPNSIASGLVSLAGQAIPVAIGETVLYLNPFTALAAFAINYQFWLDLVGLGETRIDREKQAIQDVYTAIFTYLHVAYNVPIRDGHALDFPSDGVQKQFDARPEIAALVPELMLTSPVVTKEVFAHGNPTQGQLERVVNQFLANASINNWPVQATRDIWQGIVTAADPSCADDPARWLKNPAIVRSAAIGGALLQYIPLHVLLDMAVGHHIGDPLLENLILLWADNPELVSFVQPITGLPWQDIYTEGRWALPPYGNSFGTVMPLIARDHIIPILDTVKVPAPVYPTFTDQNTGYVPIPQPPPVDQPQPVPPPPTQQPPPPQGTQGVDLPRAQGIVERFYQGIYPSDSEDAWLRTDQGKQSIKQYAQGHNYPVGLYNYIIDPQGPRPVPTLEIPPAKPSGTTYSQAELDYACTIARLAYGNAPYTDSERAWAVDPAHAALLEYQLLNPQCQIPLVRQQPSDPPQESPHQCPPYQPPGQQPQPLPPDQGNPIPPSQPPGSYPDPQHPCPPDCQYQIDQIKQQTKDCCDELHQVVLPRIIDLETWVYDIETRVYGPKPPLPYPKQGPNDPTLFPDPPDLPGIPGPIPPVETPHPIPPDVIDCLSTYCDNEVNVPPADPKDYLGWALEILCRCGKVAKNAPKKWLLNVCDFGKQAWGEMAECWLNDNTAPETVPVSLPGKLQSLSSISESFDEHLAGQTPFIYQAALEYGTAILDYGLRLRPDVPAWPTLPDEIDANFIFVDPATSPEIELTVREVTGAP